MTWTLLVDADELDASPWPAAFYIKPIDGSGNAVTITTATTVMNPREHAYPLTEGARSIELPNPGVGVQPEFFGFQVRIGGKKVIVPAQAADSSHSLAEFVENGGSIPLNPSELQRLTAVEGDVAELQDDVAVLVPQTRTVNGHPLAGDVTITKADVGLSAVPNVDARDRSTHTGTQAQSTVTGLPAALSGKADLVGGTVPANQLPSYVDDVLEFASLAGFPATGEAGKIYVALDTNLTYRWGGSTYGVLDPSVALGETSTTAYRGDRGKAAFDHAQIIAGNPHGTTAAQVGADTTGTAAALVAAEVSARLLAQRQYGDLIPVGVGVHPTAQSSGSSTTSGTGRVGILVTRAVTDISLRYVNQYIDTTSTIKDADGVGDLVIGAAVEVAGTIYRCTFAGRTQTTIGPGGIVDTDPLPIDVPAATTIYVRTFVVSGTWYANRIATAQGEGGFTATTDLTAPGSAAIADNVSFTTIPTPAAVMGRPTGTDRRALVSFGDSIGAGAGDGPETRPSVNTVTERLGAGGYVGRLAAAAGVGLAVVATGSDQAQYFAALVNRYRRMQFAKYGTTAIVNYGRNDISNGRTLAQVQADVLTVWSLAANRKMRVLVPTVTPRTTSTDGYLTVANQTATGNEAVRLTYNAWLRDGAPTVAGAAVAVGTSGADRAAVYNTAGQVVSAASGGHVAYAVLDVADVVESARDSGKWKAPTTIRTLIDGVTSSASSVISAASGAFTSADLGRVVIIPGAGTAGATYVGIIKTISSGTQIQVVTPTGSGIAVNPATVYIVDGSTTDGLHPAAALHKAIAATIPTSLIA